MYWVITRDLIGTGDRVGFGHFPSTLKPGHPEYRYVNLDDPKTKEFIKENMSVKFRLFDDDGELYYEGLATEADFDAQDCFEASDGVTYTMYMTKGMTKWEML